MVDERKCKIREMFLSAEVAVMRHVSVKSISSYVVKTSPLLELVWVGRPEPALKQLCTVKSGQGVRLCENTVHDGLHRRGIA